MSESSQLVMEAMVIDRFGGPEVLRLATIDRPRAVAGGVVIEVAYAGVNPADWKAREGWLSQFFDYSFPFVVGFDAAGLIAEVGEGVTDLKVGDRVVTLSNQGQGERGSYAQYVASDHSRVVKLPDNVSLKDATALPTAGVTAWQATVDVGGAGSDSLVVVNGGAGGTGTFSLQIAKMLGARVAVTCGPANIDYMRALGADLVINYRDGGVLEAVRAWAPDGVDLVVDTVGQGSLLDSIDMVKPGGVVAPIGTLIADEPMPDNDRAGQLGVKIVHTMSNFENQGRQLLALVEALSQGKMRLPRIEVLPLAEAGEAQRRVQEGHVCGKILLAVNEGLEG